MKFSRQLYSLLFCGSVIVGCGESASTTVTENTPSQPTASAPAASVPEAAAPATPAAPADPLLEGIELEDPAEFAQIKSAYEQAPTDVEAVMNYAATMMNFGWAHAQRGDADKSDQSIARAAKILLKAHDDKVELPVIPESTLQAQILYGYSCVLGKSGQADQALEVLDKAVSVGFENMQMINSDNDLASARELPGYAAKVAGWEQKFEELKEQRLLAVKQKATADLAKGEGFPFDFDLVDVHGKPLRLQDMKGRVCIVDIWATWCGPCRQEVPSFVKLQDKYGKNGLQIIGLNGEQGPSEEANTKIVQNFMANNSMNYPCALVSDEVLAQVPDFSAYPTTLFIDHHGKVRLAALGYHDYTYIDTVVRSLLTEQYQEQTATTN